MKTLIPEDFKPDESVRIYCEKRWGLAFLADVFLADFEECFQLNRKKHHDWNTTFKAYIRGNSPSGRFYGYGQLWERRCIEARSYKNDETSDLLDRVRLDGDARSNADGVNSRKTRADTWIPTETGRETLKHIRTLIK